MDDDKLQIAVVGSDFRSASSKWRSKLVMPEDEETSFFRDMIDKKIIDGAVVVNTCNRNEWIVSSSNPNWAAEILRAQMIDRLQLVDCEDRCPTPYTLTGENAVRYVFEVASGMRSFMHGEFEIFRQLKLSVESARSRNITDRQLNGMVTFATRAVQSVRSIVEPIIKVRGIHHLVERQVIKYFPEQELEVAVVGYGEIGRKIFSVLSENGSFKVRAYNRTIRPNQENVIPLSELAAGLAEVDVAVFSTGALSPVVDAEMLSAIDRKKPLFLFDVGIPGQVEKPAKAIENINVIDLDRMMEEQLSTELGDEVSNEINNAITEEVEAYREYCAAVSVSRTLGAADLMRRHYVYKMVPQMVEGNFADFSQKDRKRIERTVQKFVGRFSHEIISAIREDAPKGDDEGC